MNANKISISHLKRWLFSITPIGQYFLLKELKFTIGTQFEEYEFDLVGTGDIDGDNGLTYEIYQYQTEVWHRLFDLPIKRGITHLYNADVLCSAYYRFEGDCFQSLMNKINSYLPMWNKLQILWMKYEKPIDMAVKIGDVIIELVLKDNGDTGLSIRAYKFHKSTGL